MKILHVIPAYSPKYGGPFTSVNNISRKLTLKGHKVTIATTDLWFDLQYAQSMQNLNINVLPFHSRLNICMFIVTPSINNWLKLNIEKFDIIHMHTFRNYQNNSVYHYSKKSDIPYILQARGSILPFFEKQSLKKLYDHIWGNNILLNASKAIALTQNEANQYRKMGITPNKIEILPNGIDLLEYNDLPQKGEFKTEYNIKINENIILFLGRIHKIKGIDLLIQAFSELVKHLDNVKLVIAGPDGGFLPTVLRQIKETGISEKVIITGPLYKRDKLKAYVDANIYVLPSIFEAFPNTILEAYACNTPVIITEGCGLTDIVQGAGLVVGYDKYQLCNAMIELLSNNELANQFRCSGRKLVLNTFNWDKIINNLENLYYSTIDNYKNIHIK